MAKITEAAAEEPKKSKIFTAVGKYDEGEYKGLKWGEVVYDGDTFRLRQNTVQEGDDNYDASLDPKTDKFNGRLNSRLNLSAAIVSPPTGIDDMGKWAGAKLVTLLRAWDELNLLKDADLEGNA